MKDDTLLIEACAEAVHKAYCESYKKIHLDGEEYWTGGDYSKLMEEQKDIDRATVKAVIATLGEGPIDSEEMTEEEIIRDFNETYGCLNCPNCVHGSLCSFLNVRVSIERKAVLDRIKKLKKDSDSDRPTS